jgi:hypothetical protein
MDDWQKIPMGLLVKDQSNVNSVKWIVQLCLEVYQEKNDRMNVHQLQFENRSEEILIQ